MMQMQRASTRAGCCLYCWGGDPDVYTDYLLKCAERLDVAAIQTHLATKTLPSKMVLADMSRRMTLAWMDDPSTMRSRSLFRLYELMLRYTSEEELETTMWLTFHAHKKPSLTDGLLDGIVPRMRMVPSTHHNSRRLNNKHEIVMRYPIRPYAREHSLRFDARVDSSGNNNNNDSCVIA